MTITSLHRSPEPGSKHASVGADRPPLIDLQLPRFDTTLVRDLVIAAPPAVTYAAIAETNLLDPVIRALFVIRELPNRLLNRIGGHPVPSMPPRVTFSDLLHARAGMVVLAENRGTEIVIGSIGRFWEKDYGWHFFAANEFAAFREPGYAKLAIGFRVEPQGEGRSLLRYEARTATTDDEARRTFRRYWRVIRPGVALVMRHALRLIRAEAESRVRGRCDSDSSGHEHGSAGWA